jgi:DNA-binding winged helix-turn-helix (wHTH) protein
VSGPWADDFLAKPFSFSELSARIRELLRRSHLPAASVLSVADLKIDRVERRVERAGKRIDLTSKEFGLLEYLMLSAGRRVTRVMIIEHVWNLSFDTSTNVIDVYVNYLRRKVDDGHGKRLIHTVGGVGYELTLSAQPGYCTSPFPAISSTQRCRRSSRCWNANRAVPGNPCRSRSCAGPHRRRGKEVRKSIRRPATPEEMTRIISSYAARLGAEQVRSVICGEYVWARIGGEPDPTNLLFARMPSEVIASADFSVMNAG